MAGRDVGRRLLAGLASLSLLAGCVVAPWTTSSTATPSPAGVGPALRCPPGSTPDQPGPVDQARPPRDSPMAMAFDRRAGRLVAVANAADGVETWTFDVCSNTWVPMDPDREPPRIDDEWAWSGLVYDVDSDVTIWVSSGKSWAYDLQANTWTQNGGAPTGARLGAYDPISGLVVAHLGSVAFWNYDVETDSWTPIHTALEPKPGDGVFAYDASVDRMVAYVEGDEWTVTSWTTVGRVLETWLFDIRSGAWWRTGAVTPEFTALRWGQVPAIAYDEAAERTVMIGEGHSAAYDATVDRWETLLEGSASGDRPSECATRPECRQGHQMVYDPVNERLVVYGGGVPAAATDEWVYADDVLAFDTRTREWTVLLEASAGQPAPDPGATPTPGP